MSVTNPPATDVVMSLINNDHKNVSYQFLLLQMTYL